MATKKKVAKKKVSKKKSVRKKAVRKTVLRKYDSMWDPWYSKMLEAVGEYMDSVVARENPEYTERDDRIVKALIEFYGFEVDNIKDILKDAEDRMNQLDKENSH